MEKEQKEKYEKTFYKEMNMSAKEARKEMLDNLEKQFDNLPTHPIMDVVRNEFKIKELEISNAHLAMAT